jgi:hypothetical protein
MAHVFIVMQTLIRPRRASASIKKVLVISLQRLGQFLLTRAAGLRTDSVLLDALAIIVA